MASIEFSTPWRNAPGQHWALAEHVKGKKQFAWQNWISLQVTVKATEKRASKWCRQSLRSSHVNTYKLVLNIWTSFILFFFNTDCKGEDVALASQPLSEKARLAFAILQRRPAMCVCVCVLLQSILAQIQLSRFGVFELRRLARYHKGNTSRISGVFLQKTSTYHVSAMHPSEETTHETNWFMS